ncbi:hypothetical protein [Photobacterium leiognathi]|uniref:hypothetical protein n=1 Tax=Photobacterium leiognathi TaxID=553611 RepID=UPI0029812105|nr:hypothetical protein [Photobacterium leiognathi]
MPSLMLYPDKKNPSGYRVQDKRLKVNIYFPISKYGDLELAKKAAEVELQVLAELREYLDEIAKSDLRRMFSPTGILKGVRVHIYRRYKKPSIYITAQISPKPSQQIKIMRKLTFTNFDNVYIDVVNWIVEELGVERTPDIIRFINRSKRYFRKELEIISVKLTLELESNYL